MYGIRRHSSILCKFDNKTFQFRGRERIRNPIMVESATEIDDLHQQCMVAFNLYDLVVFEYTKEQEEIYLIQKLRGY
jgi:hypothetical protein